jgi:hypothetical protein
VARVGGRIGHDQRRAALWLQGGGEG